MPEQKNYGLIIPDIITREQGAEHLGAVGDKPTINPSGIWPLPDREPQNKNGVETFACTVYGMLSALESLILLKTGIKVNYADRYVANVAKNRGVLDPRQGADPHKIAELIREITGNIREDRAPWGDDVKSTADYYNIVGQQLATLMLEGTAWYKEWKLEHKWVYVGGTPEQKRFALKDALIKGPVCVSVDAWSKQGDLYVKLRGENHWTMLTSAIDDKPYRVFDSYDNYEKDLDPLYDFSIAKVYYLTPVTPAPRPFLKNLVLMQTDPEVARLQEALVGLGYPIPGATTNFYGAGTKEAVGHFQRNNGIVGDNGMHFGPLSRLKMNKALQPNLTAGGSVWTFIQSLFSSV